MTWIPYDWLNKLHNFYMATVVNIMLVSVTLELKHIMETNLISIYTYIPILCYLHGTSWLLSSFFQ